MPFSPQEFQKSINKEFILVKDRVKNLIELYGRVFKMFIVRDFIFKYKFLLANHIYHYYFFLQIFYSNHIYELNFRNTSSDNLQIS